MVVEEGSMTYRVCCSNVYAEDKLALFIGRGGLDVVFQVLRLVSGTDELPTDSSVTVVSEPKLDNITRRRWNK